MQDYFASGRAVDVVLVVVVLEVGALVWLTRRHPEVRFGDVVGQVAAGVCLLVALRFALTSGWWGWVALFLTASLPAHLWDLQRRWRSATAKRSP